MLSIDVANTLADVAELVANPRTRPHVNPVVEIEERLTAQGVSTDDYGEEVHSVINFLDRYWDSWYHEFAEVVTGMRWEDADQMIITLQHSLRDERPYVPNRLITLFSRM